MKLEALTKKDFLKTVREDLVPVGQMEVVWPEAQQPFVPSHCKSIIEEFNWELVGQVTVMGPLKNGKYHICDGQHRVAAVLEKFGAKETIPSSIYPGLDKAHAAWLFHEINSRRRKPARIHLFKTAVLAGHEPEASIAKLVKNCGFAIGGSGIHGIGSLEYIFRIGGGALLVETLQCLTKTWSADDPHTVDAVSLRTFGSFLAAYPDADRDSLCAKVAKKFTAARFINAVKALADVQRVSSSIAGKDTLIRLYNENRKQGRIGD